jgi:hypothetical protein
MTLCVDLCRAGVGAGRRTEEERWILKNMNPDSGRKIPQMAPAAAAAAAPSTAWRKRKEKGKKEQRNVDLLGRRLFHPLTML